MQGVGDADLDEVIKSSNRIIDSRVHFDWNRNNAWSHAYSDLSSVVDDVRVERDYTGDLPEETTMLEGFSSAKLSVTLSGTLFGETLDIMQMFSPYRTDSPLYSLVKEGTPIRWWITVRKSSGAGENLLQQFYGYISDVHVDSVSRTVTLTALDNVERCRIPVTLPVQAMQSWYDSDPVSFSPFYWRHNTQWPIDYITRKCGFYMSPSYNPATVIYSATCHGSPVPEIGYGIQPQQMMGAMPDPGEWYVPGQWGLAMNGSSKFQSIWHSRAMTQFTPVSGDPNEWSIQFMAYFGAGIPVHADANGTTVTLSTGDGPGQGTSIFVNLKAGTGQTELVFQDGGVTEDVVGGPTFASIGWQHIAVKVKFNSMTDASVTWKGMSAQAVNLSNLPNNPVTDEVTASVQTCFPVPIQCIQIDRGVTTSWYDPGTFVPNSSIDTGLNYYISLPQAQNTEAWELIKEVAASEFGVVGFDEFGNPYFRNRNTIRKGALTVEKIVAADTNLLGLGARTGVDSIRNVIKVPTQARFETPLETVWQITDLDEQPFLTSGIHQIRFFMDKPVRIQGGDLTSYLTSFWNDNDPISGFVAYDPYNAVEVSGSVTVNVLLLPEYNGYWFLLTINNTITGPIVFRTTDSQPSLRVAGFPIQDLEEKTTIYRRESSVTKYRERVLDIPSNRFAQESTLMEPVALSLLKDLKSPVPVLEDIEVVGDPRIQLGDTLDIQDPSGIGPSILANVAKLNRDMSGGKLTDRYTPRPVGSPGTWILGHPTRSILNQTTIPG